MVKKGKIATLSIVAITATLVIGGTFMTVQNKNLFTHGTKQEKKKEQDPHETQLAYLKKHGLKAILVVAIGVGCFSLLLPLLQKNFAHRTTHYIAIIGEYDLHNLPPVVKDQLSLGLMEVDTDGSFLPALAFL